MSRDNSNDLDSNNKPDKMPVFSTKNQPIVTEYPQSGKSVSNNDPVVEEKVTFEEKIWPW